MRKPPASPLRTVGLVLVVLGMGGALARFAAARAPVLLANVEWFDVQDVQVEGNRYLGDGDVRRALALSDEASVWDDLTTLADRARRHPMIADARVRRALPSTLVVDVVEAEPVALVAMPTLVPIDASGRVLPLDPAGHRLDLPLLTVSLDPADPNATPSRSLRRLLREWVHLRDLDPEFATRVSQVGLDDHGAMVVRMVAPDLTLLYHPPAHRGTLQVGLDALRQARYAAAGQKPRELDLRFDGQVIVRYPGPVDLGTDS